MKTLTLVRHAKSSWNHPGLVDEKRPLNKRGQRNAPEMGQRLAARGVRPDLMLTSPAVRARDTAEALAEALGYPVEAIVEHPQLYCAGPRAVLEVIHGLDNGLDHVMLFGHNPGVTDLVNRLSREPVDDVPTCGVASFQLPVASWTDVGQGEPVALDFDYPKKTA